MTGREFDSLIRKYLIAEFPGYGFTTGVLFAQPLEYVLRGYCFESSGSDRRSFYVWVFVQPLFVPDAGITFSVGARLGRIRGTQQSCWTLDDQNECTAMADVLARCKREGPVILDRFKTLSDFVKNAITRRTNPYSPYPPEMVAYAAVLTGNARKAQKMFDRLEDTLRAAKHHRDYHDEILARARRVRAALERDRNEAVHILNEWREQTAANLKLTKFLAPV